MEPVIEFFANIFSVAFLAWLFAEWVIWVIKRDQQELEDYLDSYLLKEDEGEVE